MIPEPKGLTGWARIEIARIRKSQRAGLFDSLSDGALGLLLIVLRAFANKTGRGDPDDTYRGTLSLYEQGYLTLYHLPTGYQIQTCLPEEAGAVRPIWKDGQVQRPSVAAKRGR